MTTRKARPASAALGAVSLRPDRGAPGRRRCHGAARRGAATGQAVGLWHRAQARAPLSAEVAGRDSRLPPEAPAIARPGPLVARHVWPGISRREAILARRAALGATRRAVTGHDRMRAPHARRAAARCARPREGAE